MYHHRTSPYEESILTEGPSLHPKPTDFDRGRSDPGAHQILDDSEAYVSRTLYICKLPHNFNEDEIRQACAQYGDIRGVISYPTKQIAFVEYWDIRDAQMARQTLKNLHIGGKLVDVQYSKTQNDKIKERNMGTLYVRPVTTERFFHDPNTLQEYKDLFQRFGDVKKVNTNRKREAEKFVEFHDLRAAYEAQKQLNGMDFNGVKLEVQFANTQSKTINKEIAESLPPPVSRFKRDPSNPPGSSYGPIRTGGFSDSSSTAPQLSSGVISRGGAKSTGYLGTHIKLHWPGRFGPSASFAAMGFGGIAERMNSCGNSRNSTMR